MANHTDENRTRPSGVRGGGANLPARTGRDFETLGATCGTKLATELMAALACIDADGVYTEPTTEAAK